MWIDGRVANQTVNLFVTTSGFGDQVFDFVASPDITGNCGGFQSFTFNRVGDGFTLIGFAA